VAEPPSERLLLEILSRLDDLSRAVEALDGVGRHRRPDKALPSLLRAIYRVLGSESFSTRQLLECAARDEPLAKHLARFLTRDSGAVSLGKYLGSSVGQTAGSFRLQGQTISGSGVYEVIPTDRHHPFAADGRHVP
jgi:hypothetical protein